MLFFYDSIVMVLIDFYMHSDTVSHVIYFVGCYMTIIKYMFFLPQLLFLSVRVFLESVCIDKNLNMLTT